MVDGEPEYEIERLLRKRRVRRGRGHSTEFLVRWVGYGPEHDAWYNVKDLGGARTSYQPGSSCSRYPDRLEQSDHRVDQCVPQQSHISIL